MQSGSWRLFAQVIPFPVNIRWFPIQIAFNIGDVVKTDKVARSNGALTVIRAGDHDAETMQAMVRDVQDRTDAMRTLAEKVWGCVGTLDAPPLVTAGGTLDALPLGTADGTPDAPASVPAGALADFNCTMGNAPNTPV